MSNVTVTITDDGKVTCNGKKAWNRQHDTYGRTVYFTKEYVVKVDDRGFHHDDMGMWSQIEPDDRKYFVPCLAQGETEDGICWSVQPFIKLSWRKTNAAHDIVSDLKYKYDLVDMHSLNWAMHNGEPIIFDYGMT